MGAGTRWTEGWTEGRMEREAGGGRSGGRRRLPQRLRMEGGYEGPRPKASEGSGAGGRNETNSMGVPQSGKDRPHT